MGKLCRDSLSALRGGEDEAALEDSVCGLKGFKEETIGLSTLTLFRTLFTSH